MVDPLVVVVHAAEKKGIAIARVVGLAEWRFFVAGADITCSSPSLLLSSQSVNTSSLESLTGLWLEVFAHLHQCNEEGVCCPCEGCSSFMAP